MQVQISVDDLTKLKDEARPFRQWRVDLNGDEYIVETRAHSDGVNLEFRYSRLADVPVLEGDAREVVVDHILKQMEEPDEVQ